MQFGTTFILAMISILVLAMQMQIQDMRKKLDYLLGRQPLPYAYR
jgi:hypothetical protein